MTFFGYHGISQAEKELAKRYSIDVEMVYDTKSVAESDKLELTIDYEKLYSDVEKFVVQNKFHLTETLAERLANLIWEKYNVEQLLVRVRKNNPLFPGHLDYVEVEVERRR